MADTVDQIKDGVAKLVLDSETNEMVSKNELKKRLQKRAKKAATAAAKLKAGPASKAPPAAPAAKDEPLPLDPYTVVKQGFLAQVYKERPSAQVLTRFPPEPNGYLHLGHAKAIATNFLFAKYHGGETILRFDDTNPDAEEEKYFVAIKDMIRWLGFTPSATTHSSDNFDKLYLYAEQLIQLGKAYVCHCGEADIKLQRGGELGSSPRYRCAHAEQDVATNLAKFRDMRDGKYEPQTAFLRMKQDIENGNPQMWDLAAYRIPKSRTPHFRTGDKWVIYPTYDFAHCLCDSIEGISHSLCTTEFVQARESYEWLNKTLGVYEPMQREYGRLSLSGTIMSKRALKKLVDLKIVRDWDDPRLYTLIALRRRGIPPGAILSFIADLGVTTSKTVLQIARFEQSIRRYLETTVPRVMLVLDPVPVVIENIDDLDKRDITLPLFPKNTEMGSYTLHLDKTIYIERADFRETSSPDYFRLTPGETVGLLNAPYPIRATSFTKDPTSGVVTEVRAVFDMETKKRPKAYIHWVPEGSRRIEARVQSQLFKSLDPTAVEGGFLNDINPNSEEVFPSALVGASGFDEIRRQGPWPKVEGQEEYGPGPHSVRFQAMRVAYFAMDKDSTDDHIVLNRIVSIKEDVKKA